MATTIKQHTTNYTISSSNAEGVKLEGDFSINAENRIENYNSSIYNVEGNLLGTSNYSEFENGNVNYNFNVQTDYKLVVSELVDLSIAEIKTQLNK